MNQLDATVEGAHSTATIGAKSAATRCPEVGNKQMQEGENGNNWEPLNSYDGFESTGNSFYPSQSCFKQRDHEDDGVTVRSPILCKPATLSARSTTLSPTCVSARAHGRGDMDPLAPAWTRYEFQEYLAMLELLQDECTTSKDGAITLSVDTLGHMKRLLTLLSPHHSLS